MRDTRNRDYFLMAAPAVQHRRQPEARAACKTRVNRYHVILFLLAGSKQTEAILLTAEFMSIAVLRLLTEMPVPAGKIVRCLR